MTWTWTKLTDFRTHTNNFTFYCAQPFLLGVFVSLTLRRVTGEPAATGRLGSTMDMDMAGDDVVATSAE